MMSFVMIILYSLCTPIRSIQCKFSQLTYAVETPRPGTRHMVHQRSGECGSRVEERENTHTRPSHYGKLSLAFKGSNHPVGWFQPRMQQGVHVPPYNRAVLPKEQADSTSHQRNIFKTLQISSFPILFNIGGFLMIPGWRIFFTVVNRWSTAQSPQKG